MAGGSRSGGAVAPITPAAALAWLLSPASAPWRGDLLRACTGLAVLAAAVPAPGGPVTAEVSTAGAHLLLVVAAALGRLGDGLRVPPGLLLALDALHLLWAAHVTSDLGTPLAGALALAGVGVVLRLALVPPLEVETAGPAAAPVEAPDSPTTPAGGGPGSPHPLPGGAQGQRLQAALTEA